MPKYLNANVLSTQSLCKDCGLCCDGTLFGLAKIKPDEDIVQLETIGITTISDDGKEFSQPCALFKQVCGAYHRRPRVCVSYTCNLLNRYNRSDISYEQAAKIINQAKAQKEKTLTSFLAVGGSGDRSLMQQYQQLSESQVGEKSKEHKMAEFNYSILQLQLNRHFRK